MMPKKIGDYIHLHWDDYGPHPYYIKGHVTFEQAAEVMQREQEFAPSKITHKYARTIKIVPDHEDCFDGLTSTFRVIEAPRTSYYPVTECWEAPQGDTP